MTNPAIYPNAVGWLATVTGMQYVSAIMVVVFAFLLLVAFRFSLCLSEYRADQKRLAQHAATLELRVAELERRVGSPQFPSSEGSGVGSPQFPSLEGSGVGSPQPLPES